MDIKKHISKETERLVKSGENFVGFTPERVSVGSLNRYIAGSRTPSLNVSRMLGYITWSNKDIWLDRKCTVHRQSALVVYANSIGKNVQFSQGRPKRGGNNGNY